MGCPSPHPGRPAAPRPVPALPNPRAPCTRSPELVCRGSHLAEIERDRLPELGADFLGQGPANAVHVDSKLAPGFPACNAAGHGAGQKGRRDPACRDYAIGQVPARELKPLIHPLMQQIKPGDAPAARLVYVASVNRGQVAPELAEVGVKGFAGNLVPELSGVHQIPMRRVSRAPELAVDGGQGLRVYARPRQRTDAAPRASCIYIPPEMKQVSTAKQGHPRPHRPPWSPAGQKPRCGRVPGQLVEVS